METLLRWLSIRHWIQHPVRTALTVLGVALGVAVTFSVYLIRDEIINANRRSLEYIAGKAQLVVTAGALGLERPIADTIAAFPGVAHVDPMLEKTLVEPGKGPIMLLGIDFLGDDALRDIEAAPGDEEVIEDPIAFLNSTESVVVPISFAEKRGLKKGDRFQLVTPQGLKPFVIRGLLQDRGPAKTFGGDVIIMFLDAAQVALGLDQAISRVDFSVKDGLELAKVKADLQKQLGDAFDVDYPAARGAQLEKLMTGLSQALATMAMLSVWVGILLAYNAMEISVRQRQREIAILRAIGAKRGEVLFLILLEALVLGVLSTAIGLGLGYVLARGGLGSTAGSVSEIYAIVKVGDVHVDPEDLLLGLIVGLCVPIIGAFRPARWISSRSPVVGLTRSVEESEDLKGEMRNLWIGLAILILGISMFCLPQAQTEPWLGNGGLAVVLFSSLFLGPSVLAAFSRGLYRMFGKVMSAESTVAVDHVIRDRRRAALNVASLVAGVATVVTISTYVQSLTVTYSAWLDAALPADLYVNSGHSVAMTKNVPLEPSIGENFSAMPEVEAMMHVRLADVNFMSRPIKVLSIEVNEYVSRAKPVVLDGAIDLTKDYGAGRLVLISENLARREGLRPGSAFKLKTPSGIHEFEVQAVILDFSSDQGLIVLDRKPFIEIFRDRLVDTFDIFLKDPAKGLEMQQRIRQLYGEKYNLFVLTNRDFKNEGMRIIDDFFRIVKVLQFVTLLIAVMGVATMLIAAVLDRTQEVAVMRAVGSTPGQILRIVLNEAALIGGLSAVLGAAIGTLTGYLFLKSVVIATVGWSFPWQVPWDTMPGSVIAVTTASLLAGIYPAWWSARQPTLESMKVE